MKRTRKKRTIGKILKTLKSFCATQHSNDTNFDQNLILHASNTIHVDNEVKFFTTNSDQIYRTVKVEKNIKVETISSLSVSISWNGKTICGNNQQVLLEQLEQAGIQIPFSCRAGICGFCRITLLKGEVTTLKRSAMDNNGTILCCSCLPKTSLALSVKLSIQD